MHNKQEEPKLSKDLSSTSEPNRKSSTSKTTIRSGPAILVAAAFVGPGTVLTASKAGAQFGFSLLWAVVFSVIATVALQEMAARLGIVTKSGLAESIRVTTSNQWARFTVIALVLSAILLGNCAYQTGNITGAAAGLEILSPLGIKGWSTLIGIIAAAIIMIGRADILKGSLTFLVAMMGLLFLVSAIFCKPSINELFEGLVPSIPAGSEWLLIALIGTTVVAYNLFLHASAAATFWNDSKDTKSSIRFSLTDTVLSVSIGGAITAAILITAAMTFPERQEIAHVKEVAGQLEPMLGQWAEYAFAVGILAAGLTSSITAPIAAAFATAGCYGWDARLSNWRLKAVSLGVIAVGLGFAFKFEKSPAETIVFAQVANGLLLPVIVAFLLFTMNQEKVMGKFKNRLFTNLLGIVILLVTGLMVVKNFRGAWIGLSKLMGAE